LAAIGALLVVSVGACDVGRPSVWVENDSPSVVAFFVDDLSMCCHQAGLYLVPAHTMAHIGSEGLGSSAVRVNVLGWMHEADHVGPCAPGDYDDTLYDVPGLASVRLLVDETGRPSVGFRPEPPGLPSLAFVPTGDLSEDELCRYIGFGS
jgi:hypothetical protein